MSVRLDSAVDAHLHLWDTRRLRYPWLDGTELDRPFLAPEVVAQGCAGTVVVVQADAVPEQALAEVAWLTEVAQAWPALRGIVAHAPLGSDDARLAELDGYPLVVGVRRLLQDTEGLCTSDAFVRDVGRLAAHRLPFDACVRAHQLPEVAELAGRVPDVTVVLDHLGKPAVGTDPSDWRRDLAAVAARGNTACKLSGLTGEAPPGTPSSDLLPYLEHALEQFGPERCLFGSDWPVASTTVGYRDWADVVATAVGGADTPDGRAVFGGTATRVYGLGAR